MIDSYESGRIVIDGAVYTNDVIIFPDRVDGSWWRKEGHNLDIIDIEAVIEEKPDVMIVGTGINGLMRVPDRTKSSITEEFYNIRGDRLNHRAN
jgi:hypothetical protein